MGISSEILTREGIADLARHLAPTTDPSSTFFRHRRNGAHLPAESTKRADQRIQEKGAERHLVRAPQREAKLVPRESSGN